ncbi:MAG: rhomboid family intramembrane serine protease [Pseudomonadales bacterium]|jgi:GlpG protein|nr:rhomboid family intramembrane serine protease [Pseudomonadales bacterium]
MYRVFEVPADADLTSFSRLLWQRKISHRIFRPEQVPVQVLGVAQEEQVAQAQALYGQWLRGEVQPAEADSSALDGFGSGGALKTGLAQALKQTPLSLSLVVLCCVLFYFAPLDAPTQLTVDLLYPDFAFGSRRLVLSDIWRTFSLYQFVKMLTPILLHGGLVHLVFNMLWLWELGRQIERRQSSWRLGLAIVVLALISNTVQYLFGGGNNFGGMSGVVYGLFAYIWMWQLFDPRAGLWLPKPLIFFMLLSLLLMWGLNLGMIANEAHIGGLLAGVLLGAMLATLSRIRRAAQP